MEDLNQGVWEPSQTSAILSEQDVDPLEEALASNDVVLFCKGDCSDTYEALQNLNVRKISYHLVDLDKDPDGPRISSALRHKLGPGAMSPHCFIGRLYVGGIETLIEMVSSGLLEDAIRGTDTSNYEYDVIIIGGGSAGLSAAKEASKHEKKVALADLTRPTLRGNTWGLGGRANNSGALPRKFLYRAALLREDCSDASYYGWVVEQSSNRTKESPHNWDLMTAAVRSYVETISWQHRKELRDANVTFYEGWATLIDAHTVDVVDRDGHKLTLTAKSFVIAAGSKTTPLNIPGEELISTPDDIFAAEGYPEKVLILGSGFDSIELASCFSGLGYSTSVALSNSPEDCDFDKDMVEKIFEVLRSREIQFLSGGLKLTQASGGGDESSGGKVTVEGVYTDEGDSSKFTDTYNLVINAMDSRANTDHLGLHRVSELKINPKNCKIKVNEWDQTSVPNIFAVGSVADHAGFHSSSVSSVAGKLLARRMFAEMLDRLNYSMVPIRVLSPIEYAFIGHSEESANRVYCQSIEVFHDVFTTVEGALSNRFDSKGYVKVICYKEPKGILPVVGIHIQCLHASEVLQGFVFEFQAGRLTKRHLDELITIKPSSAEIFNKLTITKDSGLEIGLGAF